MVDAAPADLVRKDKHFKDLGLDAKDYTTVDAVVKLLAEHPRLMQRPDRRARRASGRRAAVGENRGVALGRERPRPS